MLKGNAAILRKSTMFLDFCIIAFSFFLVAWLRFTPTGMEQAGRYLWLLFLLSGTWSYSLYRSGMYRSFRTREIFELIHIIFKTAFFGLFFLGGLMYFFKLSQISRNFAAFVFIFATTFLSLEKIALVHILRFIRRKGYNYRNIVIVGSNKRAQVFIELVNEHPEWGLRIMGIVDNDVSRVGQEINGIKIINTLNNMSEVLHQNVVDDVIFIVPRSWLDRIQDALYLCEIEGVDVNIATDLFDFKLAKARQVQLGNFPVMTFETTSDKFWHLFIKRLFDLFVSGIGIVLVAPVFVIVAVLIKVFSPGPIFFRQERLGLKGRHFTLYKFRTMEVGAENKINSLLEKNEMKGPVFKIKDDPRITPIGKILRKLSIDELPQLWNVLKGDMSVVGPRPPIPNEVRQYDNWQRRRLSMRPGLTCLWQVNGRNKLTDFEEWVKLDLKYIDSWSLWLDTAIFLRTVPVVLFGVGAK